LNAHLTNEKLIKAILADLNRLAAENKFSGLEKIKQILLLIDPFTIENEILTPTMKIKRNIAKKVFEKEIAELYAKPIAGA
jgi:long-chain acyl-CoA synthetase